MGGRPGGLARWRSAASAGVLLGAAAAVVPGCDSSKGGGGLAPPEAAAQTAATPPPDAGYAFTQDWFSERLPVWNEHLLPYRGKPGLRYLEVGVFEGRSAIWMLENVLTHETSRMTAVDVFDGEVKERWLANLKRSGSEHKATTLIGPSGVELRKLPLASFDIVYVDGSHTADDVLSDAVLSFGLLKDGGLLVFDDYGWSGFPGRDDPKTPDELRPKLAIDAFLRAYRNALDVVHVGFQVFVKKRPHACAFKEGCSPLGPYVYLWWRRELQRTSTGETVPLTDEEIEGLEAWLRARAATVPLPAGRERPGGPEASALLRKLGVEP